MNRARWPHAPRHTAHCNTLLHIARQYNTLQQTATHCNTLPYEQGIVAAYLAAPAHARAGIDDLCHPCGLGTDLAMFCSVLQCAALCCNVLQCVTVCCSMDHTCKHYQVSTSVIPAVSVLILHCVAVYCIVLQCIALCCSVELPRKHEQTTNNCFCTVV